MPLDGERLVIEPKYPRAAALSRIGAPELSHSDSSEYAGAKLRGRFWSHSRHGDVITFEHEGKILWGIEYGVHPTDQAIRTLGCADAWSLECESNAINTLATLVSHRQFKQYMLTGTFLESSKKSGVSYLFRRLRPTVAISGKTGETRILCTLCLHPIAYYAGSNAGAMVPSDDVIAHLMLMRGDEKMFWKRSNQHAPYRREAGL